MSTYFITAIDTDAGKTFATGLLAKTYMSEGKSVITMKMAQTGCENISEDIVEHRRLMGIDLLPEDIQGLTCPYLFKLPASPHLAAAQENIIIDTAKIVHCIRQLERKYEVVLVEGVGGVMVPFNDDEMVIDFIQQTQLPIVLVTSARLGSLNHTFLTLDVCISRSLNVDMIIYNHYPQTNTIITHDSRNQIQKYVDKLFPNTRWAELPIIGEGDAESRLSVD